MSKVSENLRYIRKAHKETQEELAKAIGLTKSAVSMYERGERDIDTDKLQVIAAHYGLTVDTLMHSDYSQSNYEISPLTWDLMAEFFELQFPVIVTEKALENSDFTKGYKIIQNVCDRLKSKRVHTLLKSVMDEAIDHFVSSISDKRACYESIANLIWLFLVIYTMIPDEYAKSIGEAVLQGKGKQANFIKKYTLKDLSIINQENESKVDYVKTYHNAVWSLISELKQSDKYSDLADYYIALSYIIGMVDNEYSDNLNKIMGVEMMSVFAELNNEYAFRFLSKVENF